MTLHDDIIPGKRIGVVSVHDTAESLKRVFSKDHFSVEEWDTHTVWRSGVYRVWFEAKSQKITQVSVGAGFTGKFLEEIGIGSTLEEVARVAGEYVEELDAYFLKDFPGICFELADVDDWDEKTAPIEFISVFPVK